MADDAFARVAARADLCRLLAACYYQPGAEFAEEDLFGSLRSAAAAVDPGMANLATTMSEAFASHPLLELQVDYTRLFMNPTGPLASPYESFWIGGRDPLLAQEATLAVLATYRAGGYEVDEGFRDLPDHIAAELEFLYTLIYSEARARSQGDASAEADSAERRRQFLARHLGRWVGPFTTAMQAEAESALYRALAGLTLAFVSAERE